MVYVNCTGQPRTGLGQTQSKWQRVHIHGGALRSYREIVADGAQRGHRAAAHKVFGDRQHGRVGDDTRGGLANR